MSEKLKAETNGGEPLNLSPTSLSEIKKILPSFKDEYENVLKIKDGDLYCNMRISVNSDYYKWLQEFKIPVLQEDFWIENGVLIEYRGQGENVVIPEGVQE